MISLKNSKRFVSALALGAAVTLSSGASAQQDPTKNVMVVFDASGSMWGQIDGRPKISIAREVLTGVLNSLSGNTQMGMIAYGHRQKGQCSDIETVVRAGPSQSTIPQMIETVGRLSPKGKTPLSDAVRIAAEEMRYTENEATVVLVTDGLETCNADPCALANELEKSGINFTAHVVGFGLSAQEGRQVACLAENTGGKYIQASNAADLSRALSETIVAQAPPPEPKPEPVAATRNVQFFVRDASDGPMLTTRHIKMLPRGASAETWPENYKQHYSEYTASGSFAPGTYDVVVTRFKTSGAVEYRTAQQFNVEAGSDVQKIDLALGARLSIVGSLNASTPYDPKKPAKGSVKDKGWLYFDAYRVDSESGSDKPTMQVTGAGTRGLLPGTYLIRGTMDRTITREKIVTVPAGVTTTFNFDMGLVPVYLTALEDGLPVGRQTTYVSDRTPKQKKHWVRARYTSSTNPLWLAPGLWHIDLGNEGGADKRSQIALRIEPGSAPIRMEVPHGKRLSETEQATFQTPDAQNCIDYAGAKSTGCVVERP